MSQNKNEIIQRWDNFITKIKERCHELLDQANQGTDMFIPQLAFDTNAIINAWTGIKNQIYQLSQKLDEGWDKMDALFDNSGASSKETDAQRNKKDETNIYINWQYEKAETIAMAKAAKQILFNVSAHIKENKMHNCTQCGAPLDIPIYTFMSKNVKCDTCDAVNTFVPDSKVIALESWVVGPLASEVALEEREKEYNAEEKISYASHGTVTQQQKDELIAFRKARINKYYQFLINSIPEKEEYFSRQRDERLKWAEIVRT